jgi:hypothetical protein
MSPGVQNMKMGPDALGTAENESGRAKYENGTRRTRYHRKRVRGYKTWKRDPTPTGAQNMITGLEPLCTAENDSGRAKYENGTRRPRYRRK